MNGELGFANSMSSCLSEILAKHGRHLARSIQLMESGQMNTSSNGCDTTLETITQYRIWMNEIGIAIAHHDTPPGRYRGRKD